MKNYRTKCTYCNGIGETLDTGICQTCNGKGYYFTMTKYKNLNELFNEYQPLEMYSQ